MTHTSTNPVTVSGRPSAFCKQASIFAMVSQASSKLPLFTAVFKMPPG